MNDRINLGLCALQAATIVDDNISQTAFLLQGHLVFQAAAEIRLSQSQTFAGARVLLSAPGFNHNGYIGELVPPGLE